MAVFGRSRQTAQHNTLPKRFSNLSNFFDFIAVSSLMRFASGSDDDDLVDILGVLLLDSSTTDCCGFITELDGCGMEIVEVDSARFSTRISAVIKFEDE